MFSRRLLSLIKRHDYSFFGGTTGWPEHIYDKDYSGQYDRREIRSPLCAEDGQAVVTTCDDMSTRSYAFKVTAEGKVEICDGSQE